jgi:hypothetical protein
MIGEYHNLKKSHQKCRKPFITSRNSYPELCIRFLYRSTKFSRFFVFRVAIPSLTAAFLRFPDDVLQRLFNGGVD